MGPIFALPGRCQSRAYEGAGGLVFGVAASKGFDDPPLSGDIAEHAKAAFARMSEILKASDLIRADVCFVAVYLEHVLRDVDGFNVIWRSYFDRLSPARCCIGAALQAGMLVEMTFCAQRGLGADRATPLTPQLGRT